MMSIRRDSLLSILCIVPIILSVAGVAPEANVTPTWSLLNAVGSGLPARTGSAYWSINDQNKMFVYGGSTDDNSSSPTSFLSDMHLIDFSSMSQVTSTLITNGTDNVVHGAPGGLASSTYHPGKRAFPAFFTDNASNASDIRLWLFGGYRDSGYLNDLWYYSVNTGLWRFVANLTVTPKANASMWYYAASKTIYIYGGISSGSTTLDELHIVAITSLQDSQSFNAPFAAANAGNKPAPRSAAQSWTDGKWAYVFGGRLGSGAVSNEIVQLNMQAASWSAPLSQASPLQPPATVAAVAVSPAGSRWVFVYAGASYFSEVWAFSLDFKLWAPLDNWTNITSPAGETVYFNVSGSAGAVHGGKLIAIGGSYPNGTRTNSMFCMDLKCPKGYYLVGGNCQNTLAPPTQPPASAPTRAPIAEPSQPPVDAPDQAPIAAPVEPPVEVPMDAPVAVPVEPPVEAPVDAPVEAPVASPVEAPVESPMQAPMTAPVEAPVNIPVEAPVESPIETPVAPPPVRTLVMSLDLGSTALSNSVVLSLKQSIAKAFGISVAELVLKNEQGVDLESLFSKRSAQANYNVVVELVGSNAANVFDSAFSSNNKTQSLAALQNTVSADTGIIVSGIVIPVSPIQTTAPTVGSPVADSSPVAELASDTAAGPIAGAVVGSILAFFLVALIVFVLTRKRAKSHQELMLKSEGSKTAAAEPEATGAALPQTISCPNQESSTRDEEFDEEEEEGDSEEESDTASETTSSTVSS